MTGDGTAPTAARRLVAAGATRGDLIALCVTSDGLGLARAADAWGIAASDPVAEVAAIEAELRPRWVWWSAATPAFLTAAGVRVATCWDLAAVHRLLFGGWSADAGLIWACLHGLDVTAIPELGQLDLLADGGEDGGDPEAPVRPDGQLRPEWSGGGWARGAHRLGRWAATAFAAAQLQQGLLRRLSVGGDPMATARSESAGELLGVELSADGLPLDVREAGRLIAAAVGARPVDAADELAQRRRRDALVQRHIPDGDRVDLRNPAQVRAMLNAAGIDVPDTRSWRLEPFVGAHPVVEALLGWRKSERIATTYGYNWLDANVGPYGRLRGAWSGSDGAAGRMTASAGLHNLPAELRPAVAADEGHLFVRADLGQIEPRVLAAVSGDPELARAAGADDLYAPVAARLGVERSVAKIAVLAAMYGQTSGAAGEALRGLESAYPVAMRYLRDAYDSGRSGRDVRTYGGRLVRMGALAEGLDETRVRAAMAARGRFARNAVIQGAAAEFFKAWAATVRARAAGANGRIVLCLHDELLVHAPAADAPAVAQILRDCLAETGSRWAAKHPVRFVVEISLVRRWSEAKAVVPPNHQNPQSQ